MSRTKLVNIAVLAVAVVVVASWAVGVLWTGHHHAATDAHPTAGSTPAGAAPVDDPVAPEGSASAAPHHKRHPHRAGATPSDAPSSPATTAAAAHHHAAPHQPQPTHQSSTSGGHPTSSPTGHPTGGGAGNKPSPSPSPSPSGGGDLLTTLLGTLGNLAH